VALLGRTPSRELGRALWQRTQGNPLFVREIAQGFYPFFTDS